MDSFVVTRRDLFVVASALAMVLTFIGLGFGISSAATLPQADTPKGNNSYEIAVQILEQHPVIDGHNDFPLAIREVFSNELDGWDFDSNLSLNPSIQQYWSDHTDLPRLRKGRVGGQFWSAYMDCETQYKDATQLFMEQIDVIKRLVDAYPDDLAWAVSSGDIEKAFADGKIASLVGVESGHAISSSLGVLRLFYEAGVRYMTLTHACNTPWADSSESETGNVPATNDGLSDFGKLIVEEMNRLGMLVDLSHVSNKTMLDALDVSVAPVMFSHSSARAVNPHSRNVPDDILKRVKTNGGIVMVNFYSCFVIEDCMNKNATVLDVVQHVNHIRNVAGVDHIGIGGDFNGVSSTPIGLEDVSKYPNLFAALIDDETADWSRSDLAKLASGNLIRVLKQVEGVRDALKQDTPVQKEIPVEDLGQNTHCMSSEGLARARDHA